MIPPSCPFVYPQWRRDEDERIEREHEEWRQEQRARREQQTPVVYESRPLCAWDIAVFAYLVFMFMYIAYAIPRWWDDPKEKKGGKK